MGTLQVDNIKSTTIAENVESPITLSGNNATLTNNVVFPAGHVISFATGTYTRTTDLAIGTSDYHLTDMSCDLVTTSTSNKLIVQFMIPDIWNQNTSTNAVHMGVRYNVGTGAFDNSAAQTLGGRSFPASYIAYQSTGHSSALTTAFVMVTATVPTVNTLRLYPILKGSNNGVHIFDNASSTSGGSYIYDEASIIAYEIKQ